MSLKLSWDLRVLHNVLCSHYAEAHITFTPYIADHFKAVCPVGAQTPSLKCSDSMLRAQPLHNPSHSYIHAPPLFGGGLSEHIQLLTCLPHPTELTHAERMAIFVNGLVVPRWNDVGLMKDAEVRPLLACAFPPFTPLGVD